MVKCTDERPYEDTVRSSHMEPRREGSGETKTASPLILNFLPPELREIDFCWLSHPVCGIYSGSFGRLIPPSVVEVVDWHSASLAASFQCVFLYCRGRELEVFSFSLECKWVSSIRGPYGRFGRWKRGRGRLLVAEDVAGASTVRKMLSCSAIAF